MITTFPGVHVEEGGTGPRPIEGVPTSTAGFLGETERGPLTPRLVTSLKEFATWFGPSPAAPDVYVAHAVRGFFENGGERLYISRVAAADATVATLTLGPLTIHAAGPGSWGNRIFARVEPDPADPTRLQIELSYTPDAPPPDVREAFTGVTLDASSDDEVVRQLARYSTLATATLDAGDSTGTAALGSGWLAGGSDGALPPGADDYQGAKTAGDRPQGLAALEQLESADIALVHAPYPRRDAAEIARRVIAHCESRRDRFAVIDLDPATTTTADLRTTLADSSYAACYHPWLRAGDATGASPVLVPPGGFVLGVYARVDRDRGVFKAPANEVLRGVTGVAQSLSDADQEELNPRGINAIREFPNRGIRVWGARTLASDPAWKYVSFRRLFIYLEHSISRGLSWTVFEPNDDRLWTRVRDTIRNFLRGQWMAGALLGRREEEAFFIRVDQTTMTQDDIDNGRLIVIVGIAPLKPAEFVIFRIGQWTVEHAR